MNIKITNTRILLHFGFHPKGPDGQMVVVDQPFSLWLKCWWWRLSESDFFPALVIVAGVFLVNALLVVLYLN